MIFSKYLRTSKKNGIIAVYHSLKPDPLYLTEVEWRLNPLDLNQEIVKVFREKHLIVDTQEEDGAILGDILSELDTLKSMSILYLVLTKSCNFRCKQCFQYERHTDLYPEIARKKMEMMSKETVRDSISAFARHVSNSVVEHQLQVQFYGGEPLMNFNTLKYATLRIKEYQESGYLPDNMRLIIVTNGSLVTGEIAAFFAKHNIEVGLSLDGMKDQNDMYRISSKGTGTYDSIMRALKLLQKYDVPITLSVTVNPDNVHSLPNIITWAKELGVKSVGFNPVGGRSYDYMQHKMDRSEYDTVTTQKFIDAYKVARIIGIYEDRMGRKADDFVLHEFKIVDCGAVFNQMVVQPDGNVAFCHASDEYNIGHVSDKSLDIFVNPEIQKWADALPINGKDKECQSCEAVSICGYGCFHNVLEKGDELSTKDPFHCQHTRESMKFLIWDLYEQTVK